MVSGLTALHAQSGGGRAEDYFPSSDLHRCLPRPLCSPSHCRLGDLEVRFGQAGLPEWKGWPLLTSLLQNVPRGHQGPFSAGW